MMMKPTKANRRNGPLPKRGLPARTLVGGKLNVAEVKAMQETMRATGIATKSSFVAHAVRFFVKAHGVDIKDVDPAQTLLPIGR